jgi:hypothetical protein
VDTGEVLQAFNNLLALFLIEPNCEYLGIHVVLVEELWDAESFKLVEQILDVLLIVFNKQGSKLCCSVLVHILDERVYTLVHLDDTVYLPVVDVDKLLVAIGLDIPLFVLHNVFQLLNGCPLLLKLRINDVLLAMLTQCVVLIVGVKSFL